MKDDSHWMKMALEEACNALEQEEVPIGAVIVHGERIVGRGHNRIEALQDATAHAEIIAISSAANTLGTWRLNDCTLYVTIEPCMMCCGAILLSRIGRVVYGATDPRFGACVEPYQLLENNRYNQEVSVEGGVLASACSMIVKEFFKSVREKEKRNPNDNPLEAVES